jgi:prepilin-type N-terminal cleavage/methylation domain-containing protein
MNLCNLQSHGQKHSFTLVEIMITVAIIGLLTAIALPSFQRARTTSQLTQAASGFRTACDAFQMYAAENGTYPADVTQGVIPAGLEEYLTDMEWTATPLGGQWDWDYNVFGIKAAVSIDNPHATEAQFQRLDAMIDDGDLGTGRFRTRSGGYMRVIEE